MDWPWLSGVFSKMTSGTMTTKDLWQAFFAGVVVLVVLILGGATLVSWTTAGLRVAIERNTAEFATLRSELGGMINRNTAAIENLREQISRAVTDGLEMKVSVQADFSELERRLGERFDAAANRVDERLGTIHDTLLANTKSLASVQARLDTDFAKFGKTVDALAVAVKRLEGSINLVQATALELRDTVAELTAEVRQRSR